MERTADSPSWLSEPPERPDPGDWRLPDERAEEEARRDRERTRHEEDNT